MSSARDSSVDPSAGGPGAGTGDSCDGKVSDVDGPVKGGPEAAAAPEGLEAMLTTLHRQIQGSPDWLQTHTGDRWMDQNPEAAKELQYLMEEKKNAATAAAAVPPASSTDSSSGDKQ